MSEEDQKYGSESEAVQAHLTILQQVIQRMASNSESSKTWCVTLVSAILVIVVDKGNPNYVWISVIPTILFLILDTYYLALERGFRGSYNSFVKKIHTGTVEISDLFVVIPSGSLLRNFFKSLTSLSIWPFYTVLLAMVYVAKSVIS
ncbi:hypothetical protein IQ273_21845 [Nodosilinea sp. LEGE 07298]|uniref:hypothetical protein n=1 Tax=Nodosilinea sp. LEGE 07298 TaxID=2777970 RepID=UPI00187F1B18|nr:hypothetical protein [Nodosilinea sp. LEGE 07298]MBE9112052.1 hypothetical protein [Nodosilinea sp. LEGE 07298]